MPHHDPTEFPENPCPSLTIGCVWDSIGGKRTHWCKECHEQRITALEGALAGTPCYVEVHQSEDRLEGVTTQNVYDCARAGCNRCAALAPEKKP